MWWIQDCYETKDMSVVEETSLLISEPPVMEIRLMYLYWGQFPYIIAVTAVMATQLWGNHLERKTTQALPNQHS
jgi:hypothetical protein